MEDVGIPIVEGEQKEEEPAVSFHVIRDEESSEEEKPEKAEEKPAEQSSRHRSHRSHRHR